MAIDAGMAETEPGTPRCPVRKPGIRSHGFRAREQAQGAAAERPRRRAYREYGRGRAAPAGDVSQPPAARRGIADQPSRVSRSFSSGGGTRTTSTTATLHTVRFPGETDEYRTARDELLLAE